MTDRTPPISVTTEGLKQVSLPLLEVPKAYVCPGDDHPIPRSVHLARLAAFFPTCRDCEHRHDTGQLSRSTVGRLEQTAARVVQASPFGQEGVRGEYLNHLTRQTAGRLAAAVADYLWERHPFVGRIETDDDESSPMAASALSTISRPVVVIGHDARPSSPDLSVGVSAALRRMGCEVVDIGRVTGPCLSFGVDHLQAGAGLLVTGADCPPQWTGLDFIGPRGLPWSLGGKRSQEIKLTSRDSLSSESHDSNAETRNAPDSVGTLDDIERRFLNGVSRPTRLGGSQRYFDAAVPYRASLLKHFRDLHPLRVVVAIDDAVLAETLRTLFESLPCDLLPIVEPAAIILPGELDKRVARQVREAIKSSAADFGVALDDASRGLYLIRDRGPIIPEKGLFDFLAPTGPAPVTADNRESLATLLHQPGSAVGRESSTRVWLKDTVPVCDAVVTLGRLLRAWPEGCKSV